MQVLPDKDDPGTWTRCVCVYPSLIPRRLVIGEKSAQLVSTVCACAAPQEQKRTLSDNDYKLYCCYQTYQFMLTVLFFSGGAGPGYEVGGLVLHLRVTKYA